ncbi:hypothetical protein FMEAI12_2770002 [Parafrankia sp. Ea1.12]|nr:hypothetical protein FMEAI12_2770002 [Parafrankia sp. Ea1.12]
MSRRNGRTCSHVDSPRRRLRRSRLMRRAGGAPTRCGPPRELLTWVTCTVASIGMGWVLVAVTGGRSHRLGAESGLFSVVALFFLLGGPCLAVPHHYAAFPAAGGRIGIDVGWLCWHRMRMRLAAGDAVAAGVRAGVLPEGASTPIPVYCPMADSWLESFYLWIGAGGCSHRAMCRAGSCRVGWVLRSGKALG